MLSQRPCVATEVALKQCSHVFSYVSFLLSTFVLTTLGGTVDGKLVVGNVDHDGANLFPVLSFTN